MFDKIIVGYDGSEGSRRALIRAISLIKGNLNSKLIVAYVNEDVVGEDSTYSSEPLVATPLLTGMATVAPVPTDPDSPRQLAREYANQMTASIQSQLEKHHITGKIVAIDGQPAKALSQLADKEHGDAIIVGNSGKSGLQKFFVGSVSEKIVKESPCTVIVVK